MDKIDTDYKPGKELKKIRPKFSSENGDVTLFNSHGFHILYYDM